MLKYFTKTVKFKSKTINIRTEKVEYCVNYAFPKSSLQQWNFFSFFLHSVECSSAICHFDYFTPQFLMILILIYFLILINSYLFYSVFSARCFTVRGGNIFIASAGHKLEEDELRLSSSSKCNNTIRKFTVGIHQ